MKRLSIWVKIALGILITVVILSGVGVSSYLYANAQKTDEAKELAEEVKVLAIEVRNFQEELTAAIIESCKKNGNPLREVLRNRLEREINENLDPEQKELIEKALPNLTHDEIEGLIQDQLEDLRKEKEEVQPIVCVNQYPEKELK